MAGSKGMLSEGSAKDVVALGGALEKPTGMQFGHVNYSGKRTRAERKLVALHKLDIAKHELRMALSKPKV